MKIWNYRVIWKMSKNVCARARVKERERDEVLESANDLPTSLVSKALI